MPSPIVRYALVACCLSTQAFAVEGFCKSWKWVTVDDFTSPATSNSASSVTLVRGGAFVAGVADDGVSHHWVVRRTTNGAQSWNVVDDYLYSIGLRNHPEAITTDGAGRVYVVGGANNLSMEGPWVVRRSVDSGQTWSLVNTFSDPNAAAGSARGVFTDAQGGLLVAGESNVADEGYHWFLRRSADQGLSWTNLDDRAGITHGASAQAVATNGAGDLFVSGWNFDNGSHYRCQVRRQLAGTSTWTMVDDFQLTPLGACLPRALVVAKGHVFVAMQAVDANNTAHWLIRRSSDNGATWSTVDDLVMDGVCHPRGMAWDHKLELFVTGKCLVGDSYRWVTRRSNDLGATWVTEDVFQLHAGMTTYSNGIDADDRQNVYAVGFGSDGTRNHWLVRRRICTAGHEKD